MKIFIHIFLIVVAGFAVYSNTFHGPFVFDDIDFILENPSIRNLSSFLDLSDVRYITFLTFAINYKLSGYNTFGYHLVNLIIHILNAVLVYFLVALTFKTPYFGESQFGESVNRKTHSPIHPFTHSPSFIAFFSGLLFVSHPIQTQAVTYIYQRSASLATFFYLLSIVMYIKFRIHDSGYTIHDTESKTKRDVRYASCIMYLASLFSAILAMKTKEISFTLPIVIILYEISFFNKIPHSISQTRNLKRFLYLLPFLLTLLIIPMNLIILGSVMNGERVLDEGLGHEQFRNLMADSTATLPRHIYFFTQLRVIVTYVRLLFLPINQNLLYDYPVFNTFFNPQVFLSFLFLASIFGLGVYLFYRSRFTSPFNSSLAKGGLRGVVSNLQLETCNLKLISFGIFWFFITLSVESSIIPLKMDVIFEHRVYLSSVGAIIAFGTGIIYLLHRKQTYSRLYHVLLLSLVIIVAIFSVATYRRNNIWKDEVALWKDVVKKSLLNEKARNNLGNAYYNHGLLNEAEAEFREVFKLNPYSFSSVLSHYNLGLIYARQGRLSEAVEEYKISLSFYDDAKAHNNLGLAYFDLGRVDDAIQEYNASLRINQFNPDAYNNLGLAYIAQGFIDEAIKSYQDALRLNPLLAETHSNLGLAYKQKGLKDKAIKEFQEALRIRPDFIEARKNLELLGR